MRPVQREAAKIAAIYAAFGVLWILLSDQALYFFVRDPRTLTLMQTYKGWAYVALTAGLLYLLVRRSLAALRLAEQRALQLQKLEALGRMAGGVAHDFNNVLTVVMGMTELARDTAPRGGVQRGQLEQALQAAERGRDLVRNLLAYARSQPVKPMRVDLEAAVQAALPFLHKLIRPQVTLTLRLQPVRVLADPSQLEQVLMNLVVNANDALPKGGVLDIVCEAKGGEALLVVGDNGVGMDEETRRRIFEPFFSTKGEQGTGLGLATVQSLVVQMGGRIEVKSVPSHGTRFSIHLPLAPEGA